MGKFCDELRGERERRKISLDTVYALTKLSPKHVQALENGRYRELPGGIFRRGILRSYLSVLGLEEAPWLEQFQAELRDCGIGATDNEDWIEFAENVRNSRTRLQAPTTARWLGVIGMAALVGMIVWAVWIYVVRPRVGSGQVGSTGRAANVLPVSKRLQ